MVFLEEVIMKSSIICKEIEKKFGKQIIVQSFSKKFEEKNIYALLGENGSGKSTLLRILAGMQQVDEGMVTWKVKGEEKSAQKLYPYISFTAPAMELPLSFSLHEFLQFHFSFKKIQEDFSVAKIIDRLGMQKVKNRMLEDFSSGMLQRVKLAQALFADTPFLFIDEPTANLDAKGKALFQELLEEFKNNRLVFIASNEEEEYQQASLENHIKVKDFQNEIIHF